MSRQLPPFVHRGSRAPSSTAGSVLGGAGGAHGAHGAHGGGGAGGSRGGARARARAQAGYRPGSRVSAAPSLTHLYPPPRPHPLQQQAFYSDDFTTPAHPHPQVRQHSGLHGGPGEGPNRTNGTIQAFSNGSMPPPPSTHPSALRMDSVLHDQPRSPLQEPEQVRHAAIVLQCINCRLIVGDSYAWVDLIEPLDLLILTAASDQIRSDGDVDPESSPTEPDLLLAQQHQQRATTLQTSPEGEPDAASTWHVLRCECGEPLGRKYVSTSFPHLDGLRGNYSFNIHQVHVYHLGSHSSADGQNGSQFGGRGALLAEEFHKMQMLLMNVGERLMRVEDKLQLGPAPTQQTGTPMHFSSSTPGPSGSSPAPSLQLATGPAPMGMPHRVKLVPNAQDAFLPPRVVARLTATPAPASGPSIATSAEMSSASQKSSSSHLTLRAQSGHQKAGQVSRSAVQSSHHDHGHQDTSPYSSPHTPTPAPSSQPSAASTRAQNTSSTTTRVNAAVGPGASSSSSRPLSPEKRSAAPDRNAAVSQNHAVNDINGAEDDNNDDEFDAIPPGDNGSPAKRRRREGPVATASGQGPTRERGSPASKPSAARGRPRKSLGSGGGGGGGGGAAAGRQSVPLSSAPAPSPRLVSRSVGVGVGISDRANANADERMVVNMEDEDDELALGADSSVLAPISDDEEEEADKVRAVGRQNGRRRTVAASVGAIANPGVDDRKAMPPPPLPPTGMRGASVPRSTKKTVAVA